MADKLKFSLVSPERELYSGEVEQVDLPGTEGALGILPNHSPLMAALSAGLVTVYDEGQTSLFFVQGGFADVTPSGLTILAERGSHIDDLDMTDLKTRIEAAEAQLAHLKGEDSFSLWQDLDGMRRVLDGQFT